MKILLIKRGAIGDLLMATPLIRQLKQKVNCELDIVVGKTAAIAIKNNPYINNTIVLDDELFSISGMTKLHNALKPFKKKYDYVFVLDKHWYFNFVAKSLGGITVGYVRERLSNIALKYSVKYHDVTRYHGFYYLDLLHASGIAKADYDDIALDLHVSLQDKQDADDFAKLQLLDNYVVFVNSGGNNAYEKNGIRMLPHDKAIVLIHRLLADEKIVVLAGGKLDFEHYEEYCRELHYHPRLINAAGRLGLAASGVIFAKAKHVYTTDCGAMHIAVAMKIGDKLTSFFGPTNPRHILPPAYLSTAIWLDDAIYDSAYQLNGAKRRNEPNYFTNLDVNLVNLVNG